MQRRARQNGFTLIEMITVVLVLSITAVIGGQFLVTTLQSYYLQQSRAELVNTSRQAIERMTRQLRGALPYAVRLTDGGDCVQFFPIAGGGRYQGSVSDGDPVTVGPYTPNEFGMPVYLTLGVLSPGEAFGGGARTAYSGNAAGDINGANWPRDSFSSRFYTVDDPQAFCLTGGQLRFFENLDPGAGSVLGQGSGQLMAANVSSDDVPFAVLDGDVDQNVNLRVVVDLRFASGGESVNYRQEVMLRNVP